MKKGTQIILCITLCFLFLVTGFYIGRNTLSGSYWIGTKGSKHCEPTEPSVNKSFNDGKININTAGMDELTLLPGIGEKLATRIIDYRERHGNFKAVEELTNIEDIGQAKLSQIKQYITVGGPS